ncbi:ABC transporter ATP-binding protein [Actinomyces sp. 2119]|uniref:ABC transporter ATP-binding protein n=1 Tax=Actinomyces lilanjuaniae TaxID=2321394 RepID=A0ABN5PU71_9ACTO|nr:MULTISPECIES: ABC transporter ATP-binding protein [Actinomyces]AYD90607.1 ABC transporter ATP-binding protein [Actinomyces lilanjuaniae]RJF43936.1 ABC transporter ATP-binding protein [Actinomyces sp. 2119]
MNSVIKVRSLHKKFGKVHAVRGIDLAVERGSVYGLIGPNGAGKTTVLRMLVDIIRPTSGSVSVLGHAPRSSRPGLRRRIGYLPGELRLNERTSGASLLRHLADISGPVAPGVTDELAERLDLDLRRPVRTLSKGNRQKLGLIQAFMHRPELLILDEPTSGLDPLVQREFLALVREAREAGQTVLLSSHVLSEIQHSADLAAVLAQGRIVAEGGIASLRLTGTSRVRGLLSGTTVEEVREALAGPDRVDDLEDLDLHSIGEDQVGFSGVLRGQADPLVKSLSRFTVRDLTIEEPDLEETVLSLYEHTGDAS